MAKEKVSIEQSFQPSSSEEREHIGGKKEKECFELQAYNDARVINLMKKRGMLQEGETPQDAFNRAINALLETESQFDVSQQEIANLRTSLLDLIDKEQMILGTPIITNAGRKGKPTSACVVIPVDIRTDLGKIKEIITPYFESAMGNGFNLSELDNPVKTLKELNEITKEIEKNCERPTANLGMLRVDHPKILEFIRSKRNEDFLEWRFNISVSCSEAFMKAVEDNLD